MRKIFDFLVIISLTSLFMPLVLSAKNKRKRIENPKPLIVNGAPVTQGQFPYHISLKAEVDFRGAFYISFCGGTLIKSNKILTAAHCLYGPPTLFDVFCKGMDEDKNILRILDMVAVGASLLRKSVFEVDDNEQWRDITDYHFDPKYVNSGGSTTMDTSKDIAVLWVAEPFILNEFVNLIPYAVKPMDYGVRECIATGAGMINRKTRAKYVSWAPITIIGAKECDEIHGDNMATYVCIETENTTILQGDSGGPLVCFDTGDPNDKGNGVVVGAACAGVLDRLRMTYYTRVTSYLPVIEREKGYNFSLRLEITYWFVFVPCLIVCFDDIISVFFIK